MRPTESKLSTSAQLVATCVMMCSMVACNKQPNNDSASASQSSQSAPAASVGTDVDDTVITGKIKAALLANENVKSLDVTVTTSKGNVMLSGFVNSQNQIDIVVGIAQGIQGVTHVDNQFTVKTGTTTVGANIDDDVITTKVKTALLNDSVVKSFDISAVTRNGAVQLSGFVDNQSQISHAVDVAHSIPGVKSVLNHMTIRQ